ncbi:hypothetical protein GCM10022210_39570 [Mucilaginibacter dorajii]|uniref:CarboxypepD_reg-like domain-containing protein n=2 Tax=Mucilaginibacter dorajii TaxID=692994 RepID=A0ABP7QKM8_9SPHI
MTNNQIVAYFSAHQQVCGRFDQEQLARINYALADNNPVAFSWTKLLAAASLITLIPSFKAEARPKPVAKQIVNSEKTHAGLPVDTATYITLRGKVVTREDGLPVPGASVTTKNKTAVTSTNITGDFELSVPSSADSVVVSYVGYKEQIIKIDYAVKDFHTISLEASDMIYKEVVVGGAFVRRSFTGRLWHKIKRIF